MRGPQGTEAQTCDLHPCLLFLPLPGPSCPACRSRLVSGGCYGADGGQWGRGLDTGPQCHRAFTTPQHPMGRESVLWPCATWPVSSEVSQRGSQPAGDQTSSHILVLLIAHGHLWGHHLAGVGEDCWYQCGHLCVLLALFFCLSPSACVLL